MAASLPRSVPEDLDDLERASPTRRTFLSALACLPGLAQLSAWLPRPAEASARAESMAKASAQLDAFIKDRVREIRWIPVTEREPTEHKEYLVAKQWGRDTKLRVGLSYFACYADNPNTARFGCGNDAPVIFWAELPSPPDPGPTT